MESSSAVFIEVNVDVDADVKKGGVVGGFISEIKEVGFSLTLGGVTGISDEMPVKDGGDWEE